MIRDDRVDDVSLGIGIFAGIAGGLASGYAISAAWEGSWTPPSDPFEACIFFGGSLIMAAPIGLVEGCVAYGLAFTLLLSYNWVADCVSDCFTKRDDHDDATRSGYALV